jgi:hypothetical protein
VHAEWEPDELINAWTLTGGDWDLIANKAGVTRLGFAVMLKFYEIEGRFPAYPEEVPPAAVSYLAPFAAAIITAPNEREGPQRRMPISPCYLTVR